MDRPLSIRLTGCTVDLAALRVFRDDGTELALTATEGRVLAYLTANHGRLITRDELLEQAWGYASGVKSRTVDTTMRRIRNKLEQHPKDPVHLITVFGAGHRFDVPSLAVPGLHGRAQAMRRLQDALQQARWVTVTGTAGVGKSSLVRAWAHMHPTGTLWVDLDGATDSTAVAAAIAAAAGQPLEQEDAAGPAGLIAARNLVALVLDGLENATDAIRELVPPLLQSTDVRVLSSSRVAVDHEVETIIRLEPLDLDASTALFVERAGLEDSAALRPIVERLGGLPLAIELAASWVPVLGLAAVETEVGAFDSEALSSSIAHSWRLISDERRQVLAALGAFEGSFTLQAARAVVGRPVAEALVELDQHCLLRAEAGQLRLYDAVRAFVRQRGLPQEGRERWAEWLATREEPRWMADQTAALESAGSSVLAARLQLRLVRSHAKHGLTRTARALAISLVERCQGAHPELLHAAWLARADALQHASSTNEAVDAARQARAHASTELERAAATLREGTARVNGGEPLAALEGLAQSPLPDDPELAAALQNTKATALRMMGRAAEAAETYEGLLRILPPGTDDLARAKVLVNLGSLRMELGRPDLALARYDAAEPVVERAYPNLRPILLGNRAESLRVLGRLDDARPLFREALAQSSGTPLVLCILRIQLSALEMEAGDLDRAASLAAEALAGTGGDQPRYRSFALLHQGGVHHVRGWTRLAGDAYERAAGLMQALGDLRHLALTQGRTAALLAPSDLEAARALSEAARSHGIDAAPVLDALDLYDAVVGARLGESPQPAIARANQPDPLGPGPTRAAWNPEVRFALGLLRSAIGR